MNKSRATLCLSLEGLAANQYTAFQIAYFKTKALTCQQSMSHTSRRCVSVYLRWHLELASKADTCPLFRSSAHQWSTSHQEPYGNGVTASNACNHIWDIVHLSPIYDRFGYGNMHVPLNLKAKIELISRNQSRTEPGEDPGAKLPQINLRKRISQDVRISAWPTKQKCLVPDRYGPRYDQLNLPCNVPRTARLNRFKWQAPWLGHETTPAYLQSYREYFRWIDRIERDKSFHQQYIALFWFKLTKYRYMAFDHETEI